MHNGNNIGAETRRQAVAALKASAQLPGAHDRYKALALAAFAELGLPGTLYGTPDDISLLDEAEVTAASTVPARPVTAGAR